MDIAQGFQIEVPDVFVPWSINEQDLSVLFDSRVLRHVTHGYYTLSCVSLGGLSHELGFHFYPRQGGELNVAGSGSAPGTVPVTSAAPKECAAFAPTNLDTCER